MVNQKKGFRDPHCSRKDCLGCNVTPPVLSPLVIRNLGSSVCNLVEEALTDSALNKKNLASAPGGKELIKKKPAKKEDANDKPCKKKPKK